MLDTSSQRDILTQKLAEVDAQLRDAKADRKETERDRRMTDAVQKLKRMHPGISHTPSLSQLECNTRDKVVDGIRMGSFKVGVPVLLSQAHHKPSQGILKM